MRTTTLCLFAAASLAACKWTEFDDLQNQTWVTSTQKPDVSSIDYGVVIQRGDDGSGSAPGGTLAVIGAGPGTYSELTYNQAGASSLGTTSLALAAHGIMTLDPVPILLASPKSAEVALVTTGDTSSIIVATGTHTLGVHQLSVVTTTLGNTVTIASTPETATYMQPLPFPGGDPNPGPGPLVASGDVVLGTIYAPPAGFKQPACKLTDGTNPIEIRALGAVSNGTTDDVLVWNGADGKLLKYSGTVFNGCPMMPPQAPLASTDMASTPAFLPGHGSQILTIDASHVLLQGHQDVAKGTGSFLQVYDTTTLSPVGAAIATDGMRGAAILNTGGAMYAVAGYPSSAVNGKATGKVLLFAITPAGFATDMPAETLYDAQPDSNELFGRSVAVMPFNGKQVIAVAADNEIFVYFRVQLADGTPLYDETRQGR
jgi:hypothetical protein